MVDGADRRTRRQRGVRLSDLDRARVYRIAYVGRRWEVLGPDDAPAASAGPATGGDGGAKDEVLRPPSTYVPRHAAPAASAGVRGHEKVPTGGQVAVPTGGHAGSPVVAM